MSEQDRKDFDSRLAELNNWQIEQQEKLRAFQEAQRRLLDLEHQNVLKSLSTHNFGQWCDGLKESKHFCEKELHDGLDTEGSKNPGTNGVFQLKYQPIKLHEPKSSYFSYSSPKDDGSYGEINGDLEEREHSRPRKFLRRGEGLARFRMTLDDFKGPPRIYKEKKIKTYLNSKPEHGLKGNNNVSKSVKPAKKASNKGCRTVPQKPTTKSLALPVKIYVPENKGKQCNSGRSLEPKQGKVQNNKKCDSNPPKVPMESLALKPCSIATEWYNLMKEKEKADSKSLTESVDPINDSGAVDVEKRKDEKELQIFEILEKKVNDSSFCSTSSFVDRLMEQSVSSTPSKPFMLNGELCRSYAEGLKSLRSQFLDEEQAKKFEELEEFPFDAREIPEEGEAESSKLGDGAIDPQEVPVEEEEVDERETDPLPEPEIQEVLREKSPQPHKVNKSLLQGYIKDFKKFKHLLEENVHRIEEPEEETHSTEVVKEDKPEQINQHEIALKLRRKGLQDNVKQLLNWECPPRKKQPKRVAKKCKPKPKTDKSKAADREQGEKIVFDSSLLKMRLSELEEEIEIFRRENKNLERLQKECNEERMKLSRERKEFEKQMQEEKEALEAKMAEEQKKLQKEKTVFEKYCKQVKNQPTRQEREEVATLKKEVERLTETLSTKEARWGASQARLRNQVKSLEKENSQLKAELEKHKKLAMKKVSFENERILNTKIMHVINSELGKLKSTAAKNALGRNECQSARTERNSEERPIRRIKSNPNVKKAVEVDLYEDASNEYEDKAPGSASTDSGIETNGSRYLAQQQSGDVAKPRETKTSGGETLSGSARETSCRSPLLGRLGQSGSSSEGIIESVVCEAVFGNGELESGNLKMSEVKTRLGRLNMLSDSDGKSGSRFGRMVRLPGGDSTEEVSGSSADEEEDDEDEQPEEPKDDEVEIIDYRPGRSSRSISDSFGNYHLITNAVTERKVDENGVWEKSFEDGSREISYPNGNVKKIFPGNRIVKMVYYNGDIKETNVSEGSEKYYYAETKTWHTTYKDGLEVLEFPNGQTERRHADGSTEISFPNGCVRYCDSSGRDEWRFADGTVIKTNESGHKILLLPNGQKEIHTKEFKRREYPDGTVKILYADGTQETRYASGRVRLKDREGNLVMDSGGIR